MCEKEEATASDDPEILLRKNLHRVYDYSYDETITSRSDSRTSGSPWRLFFLAS
jgi:hypothetical protein